MAYRKAQLSDTIKALASLVCLTKQDINDFTLSNAIRFVFSSAGHPLSAIDVRTKLEELDYNLEKYDNPLASIHTAMRRMIEGDELVLIGTEDKKTFEAGPELKSLPEPPIPPAVLGQGLRNALLKTTEQKKREKQ